jgi:hypothetical protein
VKTLNSTTKEQEKKFIYGNVTEEERAKVTEVIQNVGEVRYTRLSVEMSPTTNSPFLALKKYSTSPLHKSIVCKMRFRSTPDFYRL